MIFSVFQKLYMVFARSAVGMRVCVFFFAMGSRMCGNTILMRARLHKRLRFFSHCSDHVFFLTLAIKQPGPIAPKLAHFTHSKKTILQKYNQVRSRKRKQTAI